MNKIFIYLIIILLVLLVGFVYLFEPYIDLSRERVSSKPSDVNAIYINVTGDASCAKLYKLSNNAISKVTSEPLFLALPFNMPSPEDGEWAYADNVFRLKGYEYIWVEKNYLTNTRKETPAARFDVISWEIVTPYKRWESVNKEGGSTAFEESNEIVAYNIKNNDHNPNNFRFRSYIDCLK